LGEGRVEGVEREGKRKRRVGGKEGKG